MAQVGMYEAKTHFPKLVERVQKGETITITKHGVPVAVLGPATKANSDDSRGSGGGDQGAPEGRTPRWLEDSRPA